MLLMQPLCSGMLNSAKGTAVMLSIQNSIGIPRYLSRCWASMILSHSVWLEKGVVRFFFGAPKTWRSGKTSNTRWSLAPTGGKTVKVAPLHHLEFQVMQYSVDAPNKTGILCHEFY